MTGVMGTRPTEDSTPQKNYGRGRWVEFGAYCAESTLVRKEQFESWWEMVGFPSNSQSRCGGG
ncbi:hypothetical protein HG15A2_17150 [Adhaeretor mobilis]|uniref:Uncharacterized protein n=1 Tax=Adhaeretor mobilis TaxID=1930276 RepID=A0A517MU79_9BACT|nr:hypothetical protein HG15A2_17150 [Adhaeretor mobilis]